MVLLNHLVCLQFIDYGDVVNVYVACDVVNVYVGPM